MADHTIVSLPGDGIGKEVIPEGLRVLEAAGIIHGVEFEWTEFDWSCETYHQTGRMMPEDGIDQLRNADAIYLGAVGFPSVPDHVSLWGLLIPIRRGFDQWANVRPVRYFTGVESPMRHPEALDAVITAADLEGVARPIQATSRMPGYQPTDLHGLARGKVRHVGEAVAAVAAETETLARQAAKKRRSVSSSASWRFRPPIRKRPR